MFRLRVLLISALVVAIASVLVWFQISSRLNRHVEEQVDREVLAAQQRLQESARLHGVDLVAQAQQIAAQDAYTQIFAKTTDDDRNQAAFVQCEGTRARLESEGRKPGIVGVLDAQGLLVGRDLNQKWRYRDDFKKEFPSLEQTLTKGIPIKDVWKLEDAMYNIGAAPIRSADGQVLGAIFVGYVPSVKEADAAKAVVGTEVGYFMDGKIHASSLPHTEGASSESGEEKAMAKQIFDGSALRADMSRDGKPQAVKVTLGSQVWVVAASLLPAAGKDGPPGTDASRTQAGLISTLNLTAAQRAVAPLADLSLLVGLVAILMLALVFLTTESRFLTPLDKVERGLAEVINGNHDYVFESPSRDFEGLANGLNVMVARLLGRPDPDEDEDESPVGAVED